MKKIFEQVRAEFFPRWDRACRWRCRQMSARNAHHQDGLCVPATRTIYITRKLARWNRPQQLGVVIHEVCHAVLPHSSHGAPWLDRMTRAAKRADALSEPVLAQWLREEVRRYQTPPGRLGASVTYREIQDFVRESGIVPSFEAMVEEFSRSRSMTPGRFLRRYPRSRKLYDAAIASTSLPLDKAAKPWVLYVLRCRDHTLYCGITNNLPKRVEVHNRGKGARYTRGRGPVALIRSWPAASQSAALKAERAFKSLSKDAKERKIRSRSRRDAISLVLQGR